MHPAGEIDNHGRGRGSLVRFMCVMDDGLQVQGTARKLNPAMGPMAAFQLHRRLLIPLGSLAYLGASLVLLVLEAA